MTWCMPYPMFPALACSAFLASYAAAATQDATLSKVEDSTRAAKFAAPVRVNAGSALMGTERLYPSPVLHDMNGDGRADIVLGDLWGKLTVAPRLAADGAPAWGPDTKLAARDGKDLDFSNW